MVWRRRYWVAWVVACALLERACMSLPEGVLKWVCLTGAKGADALKELLP